MATVAESRAAQRRPAWALPAVVAAVAAVAVALVVGIRGLMGDPVRSTGADGISVIEGSFQPYPCDSGCVQGYVQDGGRSVFVILPAGCVAPARDQHVVLRAHRDAGQGAGSYRALACASGG